MSGRRAILLATAAVLGSGVPLAAQEPATLVDRAIDAYQELDLSAAAGLLRRALGVAGDDSLTIDQRTRALSYLGATEFLRGNQDSSEAAFRRLVVTSPRHTLDELVFPPEITSLFARIKRDTKVVQVELPPVMRFQAGEPAYRPELVASSFHRIVATVDGSDGTPVRLLFEGLIGDSLELVWDGLTTRGAPVATGRYHLRVESQGPAREPVRVVRVPLDVRVLGADTVTYPDPPADSLLLPEAMTGGPGIEALIGGAVAGAGIALLPSLMASDASLSGGRIAVGGTVALTGLIGFLTHRPGKPIAENVAYNESLRQDWRLEVDRIAQENERRRERPRLMIEAGRPAVVDLEAP